MPNYEYKPDQFSSHSKIIALVKENQTVLDVGCSTGFISRELKKKGCEIIGVEIDRESIEIFKNSCDEVIIGDIEKIDLPYKEKFDVIIFGDILEHLKEPLNALKKSKKYLKKDGIIILSLPNIANVYIRINLLFGRFNYEDRGILDRTHLRFFTLKNMKKLVRDANLEILNISSIPIPLPLMYPSTAENGPLNFIHKLNNFVTNLWKTLFAFQFVIVVEKGSETE